MGKRALRSASSRQSTQNFFTQLRKIWLRGRQNEGYFPCKPVVWQPERLEPRLVLTASLSDVGQQDSIDTLDQDLDASGLWQSLDDLQLTNATGTSNLSVDNYESFSLNQNLLAARLAAAPLEFSGAAASVITLPTPEGQFDQFAYWESPIMAPELAAKFPEIETFVGRGIDDPTASIRFDLTPQGFHAQVLAPSGIYYVDPFYHLQADGPYISYFRTDYLSDANDTFSCLVQDVGSAHDAHDHDAHDHDAHDHDAHDHDAHDHEEDAPASSAAGEVSSTSSSETVIGGDFSPLLAHGSQLRTYELAVASTGEYTTYHGGTVQLAMAAIVTTMNRVGGIYEDDIAVRMELVANNDQLIYTNSSTDPYSNNNGYSMLSQNQSTIDSVIGSSNYDIGHVFSTGGGGVAGLGVIGDSGSKAQGVTGRGSPIGDAFDVDYVAHEMGHQFGANHTFNGNDGNRNASTAMEPGSASTIMGYAGIMGSDDLQSNSDPYFHSISLDEMVAEITTGNANAAATITNTGNNLPTVDAGADYTIPAATPFVLTATGSDADAGDVLTYTWEQRDLGAQQGVNDGDNGQSPLFRSWNPTTSSERVFPRLADVLDGSTVVGETLPTTNRDMNFRVTIRDSRSGGGGIDTEDMLVTVVDTGSPFAVTSPNTAVSWTGNATETVTWDVASTDSGSINTPLVDILLSTDGGATFSAVAAGVANDGSHNITVPNSATSEARLKVQAVGNIFFDVSDADFTILEGTSSLTVVIADDSVAEGDGATATSGTVTRSGSTSGDLVVSLASDDTSEATVPSSVTILDGQSSASFDIAAIDDSAVDGTQTVTFSATATGYTSISDTLEVTDDEVSAVTIIDSSEGAPGFVPSSSSGWITQSDKPLAYLENTHKLKIINQVSGTQAEWVFSDLPNGQYQVATTWWYTPSRATAPYTIGWGDFGISSGGVLATKEVDQIQAPDDFTDGDGWTWEELGTVNVEHGELKVRLEDGIGHESKNLIADAMRIERIGSITPTLTVAIAADSVSEAAGTAATTATVTRTDTSGDLVVSLASDDTSEATVPLSVTILDGQSSASFEIAAIDDSAADGTQTVTFSATATGYTAGSDTLEVTDDESSAVTIIDSSEGAPGFVPSSSSGWITQSSKPLAYLENTHKLKIINQVSGTQAEWVFSDLPNGQYQVATTWWYTPSRATAPYTIGWGDFGISSGGVLATKEVDQIQAPDDFTDGDGWTWEELGTVNVEHGELKVRLEDGIGHESKNLIADAMRIERIGSITPTLTVAIAADSVSEAAGTAATTATVTRTDTSGDLVVSLASDDTSEATVPSSVTILDGQSSASFDIAAIDDSAADGTQTVTFSATATGYTAGSDTLEVTDDESSAVTIIDSSEGAPGFVPSSSSGWITQSSKPLAYLENTHKLKIINQVSGTQAEWSFTDLPNGQYKVATTWWSTPSRATAPYTIGWGDFGNSSGGVLATKECDQTQAPDDFTDGDGWTWEELGTVNVEHGELKVRLEDGIGHWYNNLIADAVRIEKLGSITPTLTVAIAADSVSEAAGTAATTATVTRTDTSGDLVVSLASDDTSEATVPLSVTILDGQSSASFEIAAIDDSAADGTQTVTFSATATGYTAGSDTLEVTDDESSAVTIIDSSEGAPGFVPSSSSGWITQSSKPLAYLENTHKLKIINQVSGTQAEWVFSDLPNGQYQVATTWWYTPSRATAPYTIGWGDFGISSGGVLATKEVDQIQAPDDFTDGDGWTWEELGTVNVEHGELKVRLEDGIGHESKNLIADAMRIERIGSITPTLTVAIAADSVSEAAGTAATTATVTRTDTSGDLVVSLASDDTSEATVPSSVTILDGQSSASFDIAAIDDSAADGTQTVTFSATATGYTAGSDTLEVTDDETSTTGQIGGTVWNDTDGDGTIDGSESLLEGWFVFLDQNQNGILDTTETALQTDSSGEYLFEDLSDGTYYVTEILPEGWEQTTPSGSARGSTASLGTIQVVGGESFSTDVLPNWTGSLGASQLIGQSLSMMGTVQQWGDDVSLASVQSAALMNADDFRADPLFVGFDGSGFATVILDSGADLNHPFFGADADSNGVSDRIVYQYDFGNDDADANDVDGHGTNVAGIAASSDSTYTGTAPGADIIILKVFADSGSGSFNDIEDALDWVISNASTYNIASINMSLGDGGTYNSPFSAEILSSELASLVAMDVMVVSAAGNEFTTTGTEGISYPAADISSLAVSAVWDGNNGGPYNWSGGTTDNTTGADRVTSFSSRSSTLTDIFAPGAYISNAGLSGGVSSYAGTSQAAPQVAGIAAVAQQLATATLGRSLTQAEFRSLMQSTGTTINDGDDEDDNVTNTGADHSRVDMWALMRGILAMSAGGTGIHTESISGGNSIANSNFGNRLTTGSRAATNSVETAATTNGLASNPVASQRASATPPAEIVSDRSGQKDAGISPEVGSGTDWVTTSPAQGKLEARQLGMRLDSQPDRQLAQSPFDNEVLSSWVDSMFSDPGFADQNSAETHLPSATTQGDPLLLERDSTGTIDDWLAEQCPETTDRDAAWREISSILQDDHLDIFPA